MESGIDFIVGTFSKSLGATGGFCVSDHHEMELTRYVSRPYFHWRPSVRRSLPRREPPCGLSRPDRSCARDCGAMPAACMIALKELGFKLGPTLSPIVAALFERREEAIAFWNGLLEQGVYVNMILLSGRPSKGKPASLQRQRGPYRGADRPHLSSLRVPQGVLMGREGPISEHWGRPVDFFQSDRTVMLKAEPSGDMALREVMIESAKSTRHGGLSPPSSSGRIMSWNIFRALGVSRNNSIHEEALLRLVKGSSPAQPARIRIWEHSWEQPLLESRLPGMCVWPGMIPLSTPPLLAGKRSSMGSSVLIG